MKFYVPRFLFLMILLFAMIPILAQSALEDSLNATIAELIDDDAPGVVLLVAIDGEEATAAYGLANLDDGSPVSTTDRFRIGSITKTYIGVVMMQLVEEETLSLDDSLSDWLDADIVDRIPNGTDVTLRQLLNMSSGIPDYLTSDDFQDAIYDTPKAWTAADTITYIYDAEPLFATGEGWEYSNSNYNLLQMVIESATEMSLADVLQEYIFVPAGMNDSYLEDPENIGAGIIQGYTEGDDGDLVNVTYENDGLGLADGGIISTLADMRRFAEALINEDLITAASLMTMMEIADGSDGYGLGIEVEESGDATLVGHSGATGGFQSILYVDLTYNAIVVGLTNNFDADYMNIDLADTLIELAVSGE